MCSKYVNMKVMKFIEWNRLGSYRQEDYFFILGDLGRQGIWY